MSHGKPQSRAAGELFLAVKKIVKGKAITESCPLLLITLQLLMPYKFCLQQEVVVMTEILYKLFLFVSYSA